MSRQEYAVSVRVKKEDEIFLDLPFGDHGEFISFRIIHICQEEDYYSNHPFDILWDGPEKVEITKMYNTMIVSTEGTSIDIEISDCVADTDYYDVHISIHPKK